MEDRLFKMFQHINMGSMNSTTAMKELMRKYERQVLIEFQEQINSRLEQLAVDTPEQANMFDGDMDGLNPFNILGVDTDATEDEVKHAFKKKAWEAHPDHGGSNEDMAKVNAAFEVIKKFRGWC